jgi:hypothetical protein
MDAMRFIFNRDPISQAGKWAFQAAKRNERHPSFDWASSPG